MSEVQCFWIEPTGTGHLQLRRYVNKGNGGWTCDAGYHQAKVLLPEDVAIVRSPEGYISDLTYTISHEDPRWPKGCDLCEYEFADEDTWQVNQRERWVRPDTGATVGFDLQEVPEGSLWDATWWKHALVHTYDDGVNLFCQLPGKVGWNVDGRASGSTDGWERTGNPKAWPPTVTASPSILTPNYHGWLRDGKLVDA